MERLENLNEIEDLPHIGLRSSILHFEWPLLCVMKKKRPGMTIESVPL
jgi:hypothetical protein